MEYNMNISYNFINLSNKTITSNLSRLRKQSNDMSKFKQELRAAKKIVILTGAGISAESGIPTFRGEGGLWRKYEAVNLASPAAFRDDPALVWEFYHYRREIAMRALPNAGHIAIAKLEAKRGSDTVTILTQNVDGLHAKAVTKNVVELHGSLFKTRCTKCDQVLVNTDSPICPALANKGSPDPDIRYSDIPVEALPHCKKPDCKGLLRPHIVWFGEMMEVSVHGKLDAAMSTCDLCVVVGTSSLVHPVALFAPMAATRGATVAEINVEPTPATKDLKYYFQGTAAKVLPVALSD